jgi:hypothetical protein
VKTTIVRIRHALVAFSEMGYTKSNHVVILDDRLVSSPIRRHVLVCNVVCFCILRLPLWSKSTLPLSCLILCLLLWTAPPSNYLPSFLHSPQHDRRLQSTKTRSLTRLTRCTALRLRLRGKVDWQFFGH